MSAALLRNNKKCNELEDDRESCLHVLTWTALRFSKHACSEGDSSTFLRAFDEEYETADGVKGGDLKKGFLLGRDIPCVVEFDHRPQLDELIEELTETFPVRYEKPPSREDFETFKTCNPTTFLRLTLGSRMKSLTLTLEPNMCSAGDL